VVLCCILLITKNLYVIFNKRYYIKFELLKIKMDKNKIKHKQLLDKLHNTNTQIKNIIESLDVGTWEYNIKKGEMIFSDRWAQMIGYDLSEIGLINKDKLRELTHPDDFEKSQKLIREHLSGELPYYKYESRIKHKNGHWVWVCERGSVVSIDSDGSPLLMFGTHTDITKKKNREESLENYINVLNHDLRSPLTTIIGYSSFFLEEELNNEEIKKYSVVINKTGKKMLKMIESYLRIAKLERGQDILDRKPRKIIEVIDEINKNFLVFIDKNKLTILLNDLYNNPININLINKSLYIDEILIYSIINNLFHNALDASLLDTDKIVLNIYNDNENIYFSFLNNGEIPKEFQKKLFKKFSSTKKDGNGIGLYSARLIARAHGGDVLYQSTPNNTRFILKIPLV
jgi:PAS domain S-box-containing protein